MSANVEITILGSGTSHGVPMIGCDCAVCTSSDPRDRRTRASAFVRLGEVRLLVDTSPELRLQCLAHGVTEIDAVLFTHHHADHVSGLDDLRRFNWIMKKPVTLIGNERTLSNIRRMFLYAFEPAPGSPHSRPLLELREIGDAPFDIGGERIVPLPLLHGSLPVLGFRFGDVAYCTDCSVVPEDALARMRGVRALVLDALRIDPHPAHLNVEQAIEVAKRVGAERTYFTHIAHQLGHAETNASLPDGIELAYDGLRITA